MSPRTTADRRQKDRFKKDRTKSKRGKPPRGLKRDNERDKKSHRSKSDGFRKSITKGNFNLKEVQCYNCKEYGHISPNCPKQKKVNLLLEESDDFMFLMEDKFNTPKLWQCAERMINAKGQPKICWKCCLPSCEGNCEDGDDGLQAYMPKAHKIMSENPEIGLTIDETILRVDESMGQSGPSQSMRPLNHELYYQPQEGHVPRDDSPMGIKENFLTSRTPTPHKNLNQIVTSARCRAPLLKKVRMISIITLIRTQTLRMIQKLSKKKKMTQSTSTSCSTRLTMNSLVSRPLGSTDIVKYYTICTMSRVHHHMNQFPKGNTPPYVKHLSR